jgi:hypothetical protein
MAPGLAADQAAHMADRLTDRGRRGGDIEERQEQDPSTSGDGGQGQEGADHRPVEGQAAVPHREQQERVDREHGQVVLGDVQRARTDERRDPHPQRGVSDQLGCDAATTPMAGRHPECDANGDGDDDPVPADVEAEH